MPPKTPLALWYGDRDSTGIRVARAALAPLSWIYAAGAALHRGAYAAGVLHAQRMPARTVAIGNLVAGGAGKTPVVMALAGMASEAGLRVAVVSRGYGVEVPRAGLVVSTGQGPRVDAALCGDEPWMLARNLPGVAVAVGPDRAAAAHALMATDARPDLFLLDDAMQHHRVAADALVAVVKPPRVLGNGLLLPAGPLRERPAALRRADLVVAVGELDPASMEQLLRVGVEPSRIHAVPLQPVGLLAPDGAPPAPTLDALRGMPAVVTAAIARPDGFLATARELGVDVRGYVPLADHAPFDRAAVDALRGRVAAAGARALLMTEKDLGRWPAAADVGVPAWAVRVALRPSAQTQQALFRLLAPPPT